MTTREIAGMLNVSRVTVTRWIKTGQLKAFRLSEGGNYRILTDDFLAFLKRMKAANYMLDTAPARTVRILVVDDSPQVVDAIRAFLEQANSDYHVVGTTSSFDAGCLVYSFKPDIVILDIVMPMLDGFQVCQRIKNDPATAHIKIIAITGYATKENIEKIMNAGASVCLAKPFDYNHLVEEIEKALAAEPSQETIPRTGI